MKKKKQLRLSKYQLSVYKFDLHQFLHVSIRDRNVWTKYINHALSYTLLLLSPVVTVKRWSVSFRGVFL